MAKKPTQMHRTQAPPPHVATGPAPYSASADKPIAHRNTSGAPHETRRIGELPEVVPTRSIGELPEVVKPPRKKK